jgi:hypothetical protein
VSSPTGIAAPEPRIMVTVLGLTAEHVRVVDARRSGSDVDVVRVELGDVHFAGDLHTMTAVLARAAEGLVDIDAGRRGPIV